MNLESIIPGIVCGNDTHNDMLMSVCIWTKFDRTMHSNATGPTTAPRRFMAVQQKGEWQCFRLGDTNRAHALNNAVAVGSAE